MGIFMSFVGHVEQSITDVVTNNGFYPDIALVDLQQNYNLPSQFNVDTIKTHCEVALMDINRQLKGKQSEWQQQVATLAELPCDTINGQSERVLQYQRAVACRTKALLLQQYADQARKGDQKHLVDEHQENQSHWLSESQKAVNDLLGKTTQYHAALL